MLISVITPAYNSARTIGETLKSIVEQSYPHIEHIVVDGASNDNTRQIVKGYGFSRIVSEKDDGIYDAMNKGIKAANGDVIGILNSDDFYANCTVIEKVASIFKRTDCDLLYADMCYVSKNDINNVVRYWKSGKFERSKFLYGWMPPHPTMFVRRSIYERYGTYRSELKISADYELMLQLLYKENLRIEYFPEVIVKMRVGGESGRSIGNRLKANAQDRMAWKHAGMKPYFFTTFLKPLRKIFQFINHPKKYD